MAASTPGRVPVRAILFAAVAGLLVSSAAEAQRPLVLPLEDAFGYLAYVSDDDGCATDFVDIATTGTPISLAAAGAAPALDEGGAVVELQAPFELYGQPATHVVVSSNGYLAFTDSLLRDSGGDFSNDCPLPAIPDAGPSVARRLMVLHDDLDGGPGSGWILHQHFAVCPRPSEAAPDEACTVIQWDSWSSHSGADSFDAQAVLYHSSLAIAVQYRGTPPTTATIGIQDATARIALAPTCAGAPVSPGAHAICFFEPRALYGGPFADLSTSIDEAPKLVVPGGVAAYTVSIANRGPSAVSGATVASVVDPNLDCSWTCEAIGGSCTAGPTSGPITDVVTLNAQGFVTYRLECTVDLTATSDVSVLASSAVPPGTTDPEPANDASLAEASVLVGALFFDDFESGDTDAWDVTIPQ